MDLVIICSYNLFGNYESRRRREDRDDSCWQQPSKDFVGYEKFMMHFFLKVTKKVEGVGWAILVWSPRSRKLEVLQAERHQRSRSGTPFALVLDVWEHAYYLQYRK